MARPRTYKTQGIVLKHTPLGEADRIVALFTPDMGKLRAVARGVRRPKSKLGGHLEPLTHVLVSLAQGRNLDTITEAETIRSFRGLREDLRLVSRGIYLAELVESFSVEQSPAAAVFELLLNALAWMEKADSSELPLRYFEVQLLRNSGFGPELYRCVECNATLEPGDHLFSSAKGGILCPQCRAPSEEALVPLSLGAIKLLRFMQREAYPKVAELRVPPVFLEETERLLRTYIRHVLERELKSAEFMNLVTSAGMSGAVSRRGG